MAPLPALSRDGRQMAFIASRGATPLVWVQTLGEIGARALSGTENGAFPFWSPDGDFVAFAAGDRLKKIAVSSIAPQDDPRRRRCLPNARTRTARLSLRAVAASTGYRPLAV